MKPKTASRAAASAATATAPKGATSLDGADEDLLLLDTDENVSATSLTASEKARHIEAANAAREDDDDDDDDLEEDDKDAVIEEDDSIDDDALDKEFEEFDLPKSNRGGKKAGDDDEIDEEFRDLGLDSGGGLDDDDDDF